ncbi:putative RIC1 protein [Apiospora kogelbergensis]|uniref:RIC1 protein n=1 Tax=Apiospora kogelbergensis TaxID=1337665 RepID=A0AAW0QBM3_9PEZI
MSGVSGLLVVLITIFFPPLGVFLVAGCGADVLVNICLTILGVIPGHVHAFYIEYVYYDRREQAREGRFAARRAPAVYSERVQTGGQGYGTMAQSAA